ncbi:hypothetical protein Pen01_72940 [Phytomonospora endophytica]|nr:hypothetical protein Pen01_72940 [Phytomonospora endophytica]
MLLQPRKLHDLPTEEALRRVASVSLGRLVYFARALPAVWPTTHLVDGELIVVLAHRDSALCRGLRGSTIGEYVIAYEVDIFNGHLHTGWCVVVTGPVRFINEEEVENRVDLDALRSRIPDWADAEDIALLGIRAEVVTGYELGTDSDVGELTSTA